MRHLIPRMFLIALAAVVWNPFVSSYLADSTMNLPRALEAQQRLIASEPSNPVAWNDLGNLLVLDNRIGEAEEAYRRALSLDYNDLGVRLNLALLLHQTGRVEQAESDLLQILERDPRHARAHYQIGIIMAGRGERETAIDHYARALAYDFGLTFAENNPHIIENPLFSEALLRSQRYSAEPGRNMPRLYGDVDRIRLLMLEDEKGEDGEEAVGEEDDYDDEEDGYEEEGEGEESASRSHAGRSGASPGGISSDSDRGRQSAGVSSVTPPSNTFTGKVTDEGGDPRVGRRREALRDRGTPPAAGSVPSGRKDNVFRSGATAGGTAAPDSEADRAEAPEPSSTRRLGSRDVSSRRIPTSRTTDTRDESGTRTRAQTPPSSTRPSSRFIPPRVPTTAVTPPSAPPPSPSASPSPSPPPPPPSSPRPGNRRRSSAQLELKLLSPSGDQGGETLPEEPTHVTRIGP